MSKELSFVYSNKLKKNVSNKQALETGLAVALFVNKKRGSTKTFFDDLSFVFNFDFINVLNFHQNSFF